MQLPDIDDDAGSPDDANPWGDLFDKPSTAKKRGFVIRKKENAAAGSSQSQRAQRAGTVPIHGSDSQTGRSLFGNTCAIQTWHRCMRPVSRWRSGVP